MHTVPRGGSVLVRRRIQTPSVASVLSVVQPEGEVVLGASPPARLLWRRAGGDGTAAAEVPPRPPSAIASDAAAPRRYEVGGGHWTAAPAEPARPPSGIAS